MIPEEKLLLSTNQNSTVRRYPLLGLLFERIAFYGLLIAIILTAIPYGTVTIETKLLFVVLSCIFTIFRILEGLINKNFEFAGLLLFAPLFGILLLAIIQIIPFHGTIDVFSNPEISGSSISLDSYETKNFILIFASLLMTGEVLLRYTNSRKRLLALIYLVLGVGIASALFGFIRLLFFSGEDNFLAPFINDRIKFAQFVNKNHFAVLMEMTLGLLIGLFIKADLDKRLKPLFWLMIGSTVLAVILANSRGGILSVGGLGFFTILLYFLTKNNLDEVKRDTKENSSAFARNAKTMLLLVVFSVIFFGAMVFTVSFVGGDALVSRIETIQNEVQESDVNRINRLEIWQSTINLIKVNPIVGIGFGAYQVAITPYDKSAGKLSLRQAHNDYLELLASGGIIGFILMLLFLILLIKSISEQLKSKSYLRQASCFGGALGIFAVMLHSVVDFGLHVLINALIFVILIVIATAKNDFSKNAKRFKTMRGKST